MVTLQELLDSVADDLYSDVDYVAKLNSGGYPTPDAVKLADKADLVQACGLRLGEATVIWKAACGDSGRQLAINSMLDGCFSTTHMQSLLDNGDTIMGALQSATHEGLQTLLLQSSTQHNQCDFGASEVKKHQSPRSIP